MHFKHKEDIFSTENVKYQNNHQELIKYLITKLWSLSPLNSKSDQPLISPYSNTAESFIKIMRIKEIIFILWNFD